MRKTERARRIVGIILVVVLLVALAVLLSSQPLKRQTVLIQTPSAYPYAATMYSYETSYQMSYQINGAPIAASPVSIDTCSSNFLGGIPPTFQSSDCSRYYGSDGTASVLYWGPGALNWTR